MIILDTDHINILQNQHGDEFQTLTSNMSASADQDFVTTVITLEEQMRGWLALIHRSHDAHRQVAGYDKLNAVVFFGSSLKAGGAWKPAGHVICPENTHVADLHSSTLP